MPASRIVMQNSLASCKDGDTIKRCDALRLLRPTSYNNNRRAILAIEKGAPGDRVFAEAFKTWKQ
jgi:hypothetical protein